jgi:hypothetical protein
MRNSKKTVDDVIDEVENILASGNAAYVTFRTADGTKKKVFIRNQA